MRQTIEAAIGFSGVDDPSVWHLPRLLSDNGPCYVSKALGQYLETKGITHLHGKSYHPMTQGRIERYHRPMSNILLFENYDSPCEFENQIGLFVDYCNNYRCHEALSNVAPADMNFGRDRQILTMREQIKTRILR